MRTLLICHEDAPLDRYGLTRWLGSFSDFAGTLVIRELPQRKRARVKREIKRVGYARLLDVAAFRALYALRFQSQDAAWEQAALDRLERRFAAPTGAEERLVPSPNSGEAREFIARHQPDIMIARCKTLLQEDIFSIPRLGTFALHPGICPAYRNAHGCFWAMAAGDWQNVGLTLLRIDRGVDTGPIFGQYRIHDGFEHDSHIVIQHRALLEHLDAVRNTFQEIAAGEARPLEVDRQKSAAWGQPWLSAYLRMKSRWAHHQRPAPRDAATR